MGISFGAGRDEKLALLIIPIIGCLIYLNTLGGDLVYDDRFAIVENPTVTGQSGLAEIFTTDFWGRPIQSPKSHKSYRPVTVLSFRLNYLFVGLRPAMYHATNVFLHGLSCFLFVMLARFIFGQAGQNSINTEDRPEVWISGLLFALHPVHVEAVANIVGRAELLCAIFFIASFLVYARHDSPTRKDMILSLILCVLAMLSKETGIMSFALLLLYEIVHGKGNLQEFNNRLDRAMGKAVPAIGDLSEGLKREPVSSNKKKKHPRVMPGKTSSPKSSLNHNKPHLSLAYRRMAVIAAAALIVFFVRMAIQGEYPEFPSGVNQAHSADTITVKGLTYLHYAAYHARLLIFPHPLCADYESIPLVQNFFDARVLGIIFLFACLGGLLCLTFYPGLFRENNQKSLLWGFAWLLAPFLPVSNLLFPVGFSVAERVLYLPSIGFCILAAVFIGHFLQKSGQTFRITGYGILAVVFILYGIKTFNRNMDWNDPVRLMQCNVRVFPDNSRAHFNLGYEFDRLKRYDEAMESYRRAIAVNPDSHKSYFNLGIILLYQKNNPQAAERVFDELTKRSPKNQRAWNNLGVAFEKQKKWDSAESAYRKTLALNPGNWRGHVNLGDVMRATNRPCEAIQSYSQALELADKKNLKSALREKINALAGEHPQCKSD
jgi:protein O-mannosyl-transferase